VTVLGSNTEAFGRLLLF